MIFKCLKCGATPDPLVTKLAVDYYSVSIRCQCQKQTRIYEGIGKEDMTAAAVMEWNGLNAGGSQSYQVEDF